MATDSASPIYGLRLQATGNNTNTWGSQLNDEALKLIEEAGDGVTSLSVSASITLTATNYVSSEARQRVLVLYGSPAGGFTVTVPNREKLWLFVNRTGQTATVKTAAGAGVAIVAGDTAAVLCDGVDCALADNVTRQWVRNEIQTAALSGTLPNQSGNAGKVLTTDGTQVSWQDVDLGGGAQAITSAVDVTLTASLPRVLAVTMTAAGRKLTLPDATGLTPGGPVYAIKNAGVHTFRLHDSDGRFMRSVPTGASSALFLADNSTSAGDWQFLDKQAAPVAAISDPLRAITATAGSLLSLRLSDGRVLSVYSDGAAGNQTRARVLTWDGAALSAGPATHLHSAAPTYLAGARIDDNRALLVYSDSLDNFVAKAQLVDISDYAISAGTKTAFDGTAQSYAVAALSSSRAMVAYRDKGNSDHGTACMLNISAGGLAAETPVVFDATATSEQRLVPVSASRALAAYTLYPGTERRCIVLEDSAGGLAAGSPTFLFDDAIFVEQLLALPGERAVALTRATGRPSLYVQPLAVSADAVSVGTTTAFREIVASGNVRGGAVLGADRIAAVVGDGDKDILLRMAVDGDAVGLIDSTGLIYESAAPAVDILPAGAGQAMVVHKAPNAASSGVVAFMLGFDK